MSAEFEVRLLENSPDGSRSRTSCLKHGLCGTCLLVFMLVLMPEAEGSKLTARTREGQEKYLRLFGYLTQKDANSSEQVFSETSFTEAVKNFQRMAGLRQTGTVDEATVDAMELPRCGVKGDLADNRSRRRRQKRFALEGSRWHKSNLSYRINSYPKSLSKKVVDEEIRSAFQLWSEASSLSFTPVDSVNTKVDIDILFARGYHGDESRFDGPGGILAHANFPGSGGDVHFDESEHWTTDTFSSSGTNLLQVAVHELGHSLGLGHSNVRRSIMSPFYQGVEPKIRLQRDDISGIRYLYGSKQTKDQDSATPVYRGRDLGPKHPRTLPEICNNATIDAIFALNDDIYIFQGNLVYLLQDKHILDGFPKLIGEWWPGLPEGIDAAFHWKVSSQDPGLIYFFKNDKCWLYDIHRNPLNDNPQEIANEFRGLPSDIDTAFVWGRNNKLYFFKGDQYYRYIEGLGIGSEFPKSIQVWKGLPDKIDAALSSKNGKTYFFSGQNHYRLNDAKVQVDFGYPKSTRTHWLDCKWSYKYRALVHAAVPANYMRDNGASSIALSQSLNGASDHQLLISSLAPLLLLVLHFMHNRF